MAIQEIRVAQIGKDVKGEGVAREAHRTLGVLGLTRVMTAKVYRLEGVTEEEALTVGRKLLTDPKTQVAILNSPILNDADHVIEVAYNPGVMNSEAETVKKAAKECLGITALAVDTSTEFGFDGDISRREVDKVADRLLVNKTVERVVYEPPKTLVIQGKAGPVNEIPIINATTEELMVLSRDQLFLNENEMGIIQEYFRGLRRNLTDCELETIAARWSEHCGHKTFKAKLIVDGKEKSPLYTRIKETARKYFKDYVISAFEDNSGVIRFYDGEALCGKVETHNKPSSIEPYGGAMTGSGGVFRDVLGTGQGGKVTISTDMFCFAPPDLNSARLPQGCLPPDYIQRRVVAGVRDYGNRMGIPTNNGSVHYHEDFRTNPTVIVGTYGIIPENRAQKGEARKDDLVVVIGGRTGRDGIHGATFSSGESTDRTINVNSSAVQIGNPIEEKRFSDAIIEARDKDLIRAITDCGAAGLMSAVTEIAEHIGVTVDIEKAPVKYPGLAPWEIWLSESQERMVTAIAPENKDEFLKICKKWNVEATILGEFDGSHKLTVNYGDQNVVDLDYEFLNHGLPQREMKAHWEKPHFDDAVPEMPTDWTGTLERVLAHGNVCSKEPIVRQYDHGVQGTNVLPPFTGVDFDGPNDAAITTPILGKPYGMVQSHGMNPILNRIDPYWGSVWATAEGMANAVAVGGNPEELVLVENFIWPFPDEDSMGALDKSVDAVVDCMNALKIPVVSGKDSLSSTYRGKDGLVIKIPPVLCMSVFGRIPDVKKTVSSDLKKEGSTLVLVGEIDPNMGGSTYYDINGLVGNEVSKVNLETLPKVLNGVHKSIVDGKVLSCHDVSEGGVIGAISEMCFGGGIGVKVNLEQMDRPDMLLFNETAGCFVIEVDNEATANEMFGNLPHMILGKTQKERKLEVEVDGNFLFEASTDKLKRAWQEPLRKIFGGETQEIQAA